MSPLDKATLNIWAEIIIHSASLPVTAFLKFYKMFMWDLIFLATAILTQTPYASARPDQSIFTIKSTWIISSDMVGIKLETRIMDNVLSAVDKRRILDS